MDNHQVLRGYAEDAQQDSYPLATDNQQQPQQEVGGKEEEANEDCPLKGLDDVDIATVDVITAKENDANATSGQAKELRHKGLRAWFAKQQVKWCIAILVAFVLLTVVLVATLLVFDGAYEYFHDNTPRLMRIWPKPNRPDSILFLRPGFETRYDKDGWQPLIDQVDGLMAGYGNGDHLSLNQRNVTECFGAFPPEGYSCFFNVMKFASECSAKNNYGYQDGSPCVFLQFNNITGWKPESYTTRDLETDDQVPVILKATYKPNLVSLDCQGETMIDQEHIGTLEYSPDPGFKFNFFPYSGQQGYMPPMVAVRFKKPAVGVAISVICKLWAKNINHTEHSIPSGSLHFTLLLE